ncbi:hypothetical protein [Paraburkholderia sp. SOS3]|uniref:hypothetical protein n=1 Tax=Paraburkholderia sp. SOS3 TaxID=1926494 RepID=UPI0009474D2B|nr:hypothetical protein [Paraburkholderia sp. SOS3]APR39608.1 hypothetical protein BTO02_30760 [Paraburkholderia sp. SOS3]
MPIDFNRVPPPVTVPAPPRLSTITWTILLALTLLAGAGLAIVLWPAGRPTNTPWFWFCLTGYPFLTWAFLLCSRLGYGYMIRAEAIAANSMSDEAKDACHALASRPFAVLGRAWCFSTNETVNALDGIRSGSTKLEARPRPPGMTGNVAARWMDCPVDQPGSGNELDEYARHRAICTSLLARFTDYFAPQINALPAQTELQVKFHVQSKLKSDELKSQLRALLLARTTLDSKALDVQSASAPIPLFQIDAWLDNRDDSKAYLLIAIELRDALSTLLPDGVAEAGVALLVGRPHVLPSPLRSTATHLHRPAKGERETIKETLELVTGWSGLSIDDVQTVWTHGLTGEQVTAVQQAANLKNNPNWMRLETSVGDCSSAGPWLAAAFAAENARATREREPQLVLSRDDNELVALVCK